MGVESISSFSGTLCRMVGITETVWAGNCQRTINVVQIWCKYLDEFCNKPATSERRGFVHKGLRVT